MTREEMTREDMYELLPELKMIQNQALRETCADVWIDALDAGGWFEKDGWGKFPFYGENTMRDDCPENLLTHTGQVTLTCAAVYDSLAPVRVRVGDCDRDVIVASALLHDVGKLIEFVLIDGKPHFSESAKKFRHPIWGYYFAKQHNLPEDIVHAVLTHSMILSPEGPKAYCTPESWIVKVIDDMCYKYVEMFCGVHKED